MSTEIELSINNLVVYKKRPARIAQIQPRLEIELEDGNRAKVRPKDVIFLHPGPLAKLKDLKPLEGDIEGAWTLLSEDTEGRYTLPELAEWIFGEFTPSSAWATWEALEDGLYFTGNTISITPSAIETVQQALAARQRRKDENNAWQDFLNRIQGGEKIQEQDRRFLQETEQLALGKRSESRLLRELGRTQRIENAHALLISCDAWQPNFNPYPERFSISTHQPDFPIPTLQDEPRLDLTHLESYAIDDRMNQDPDDAVSLESLHLDENGEIVAGCIWVHVADAAALVRPNTPVDLDARERGATFYLPEGQVSMLPLDLVQILGIGLQAVSPALSFRMSLDAKGGITQVEIHPSVIKAQRLSYEQAESLLDTGNLLGLHQLCQIYQARREANGASMIDLPEVIIHVEKGQVDIRPLLRLRSRDMVREAMLMAGEAAARFAIEKELPFPFATQEGSFSMGVGTQSYEGSHLATDLARNYAQRRAMKRGQVSSLPMPHAGVGLPAYSRATSPLRRYLDLTVHQQLRAFLKNEPVLNGQEILARLGTAEIASASIAAAEGLSRRHWTLIYLEQNPDWCGQAVLVEKNGTRGKVIIPQLALEVFVHIPQNIPLNTMFEVRSTGVNLPELEAHFQLI